MAQSPTHADASLPMPNRFANFSGFVRTLSHVVRCVVPKERTVWVVSCDVNHVPFMPTCANCLAAAKGGHREVIRGNGGDVLVPYCPDCLSSMHRNGIAALSWNLSSILLGVAACLYLPLIPWISERAATVIAASVAGLPWLVGQVWKGILQGNAAVREKAVYVEADGLLCLNSQWAMGLGNLLGVDIHSTQFKVKSQVGWACGGVVIALVATPWFHDFFHPIVRMLNLTDDALIVFADNHELAKVQPTSGENSMAGAFIRVPAGKRRLTARHLDGTTIDDLTAYIFAGRGHLFAPGRPDGICFWLERSALGRAGNGTIARRVLAQQTSFWSLNADIDVWFRPALGSKSAYFTGGVVTALRQGTCPSPPSDEVE